MSATVDQIEAALLAPFLLTSDGGTEEWTGSGYDAIAYDNAGFTPTGSPWIEVVTSAGPQGALTVDVSQFVANPTVIVSAHTAIGTGKAAARQLIDTAYAIYRGRIIQAGGCSLHAYAFSQPVELPYEGYYKLSGQISFRLY